jgi:hypothetical protein
VGEEEGEGPMLKMNHRKKFQKKMLNRNRRRKETIRVLNLVTNPARKRKKVEESGQNILAAKSNRIPGVLNQKNQILTWVTTLWKAWLIQVIDESALEPPEPDYARLPARPFETEKQVSHSGQSAAINRGKKLIIKESELAPLKAQIKKADAARAFKERFGSGQKANVLSIGEDGIARRQQRVKPEEEVDDEIDDIDSFLAELDMHKGKSPLIWLINRFTASPWECNKICTREKIEGTSTGLGFFCR